MDTLHGYYFEDLTEGQSASFSKTLTEADVTLFAGVTGDFNPVHINEEFAAASPFKGRICHGMLTAGLISTVLGMKLPGPGCIYVSQSLRFKAPVRIGDTATARVTVKELKPARRMAVLETVCLVGGRKVLEGEAVVMVDARPA
ncbi:MaoC family dehydratase [Alkalilimnicola sp. S0819]|uniref:MaoC family dehydratase n=1 Tax=Alkalilimnicola sp. S0819 TaxID=2613922 RepID=UPI0012623D42|nr:MaoC family dehydratase [Alkalilimnicola sp. S0819]KAB7622978.1 MaoC family dehydratase [Alkalilimnicola sp. S0819]MPQ17087.1 (R)-hydratase [Alkalilimnicola sp. S0819]